MNAEASNQKVGWMTVFSVVAVWFGAHAGGGFASGNQEMNFFVQYGWPALITPIISMIVLAIVYRVIVTMCNQHNSNHYRAWADHLYSPHEKVISPIYEVCNLGAGMLATSASVAGAAAIINQQLGLNYMLSVTILTIAIVVLSMFGAKLISQASSVLVVLIMISVLIISIVGLAKGGWHIAVDVRNNYAPKGVGPAIWKSIAYASFQIFSLLGTFGVCCQLRSEKNCNRAAAMGFVINAAMLALLSILILAYRTSVATSTLPILDICKSLNYPILTFLYEVSLFCAFISTAVSVVFGTVMRFEKFHTKFKLGLNVWNAIVGLIVVVISMFAASFGLTAIVAVGYNYLGIIGIFLVAIPAIIVGTKKIRAFKESGRRMGSDVAAEMVEAGKAESIDAVTEAAIKAYETGEETAKA
jgi:uncharacterized membrane protein YkvI